jgi:YtkA-like
MLIVAAKRARAALLTVLAIMGVSAFARAEITNYEFQLVEKEIKKGDAILSVRLVHKPDGELVSNAVIFATRLDMAPDGMETMKTTIEPAPSKEPGVYRFKVNLMMQGGWRLSLGAKVQGETGTIENKLILKALP